MLFEVSEHVRVSERAAQLGCLVPDTIAIMPENYFTAASRHEFQIRTESVTLRALFEDNDIPLGSFVPLGEHAAFSHNREEHWEVSLFIPGSYVSSRQQTIATALVLISRHLEEFFRGPSGATVRLTLVFEVMSHGLCKRVSYRGNVSGIMSLNDKIREVSTGSHH